MGKHTHTHILKHLANTVEAHTVFVQVCLAWVGKGNRERFGMVHGTFSIFVEKYTIIEDTLETSY